MPVGFLVWYVIGALIAALVAWFINSFPHPRWLSPGIGLAGILAMLLIAAFVQYKSQSRSGEVKVDKRPVIARTPATRVQTPSPEPDSSSNSPAGDGPSASPDGGDKPSASLGGSAYLADLVPQSNQGFTDGPAALSGRTYARSALISCYYRDVYAEYTLGRSRTTLSAELGIDDQKPGDSTAYVVIYGDDHSLGRPRVVRPGSPVALSLNVKNVLKLKFVCTPKQGQEGRFRLVLGDAKVS